MAEKESQMGEEFEATSHKLKERKVSWAKLRRVDSLHMEAGRVPMSSHNGHNSVSSWERTLSLAFQSIGVVYGDLGTCPLYVYSSTFPDGIIKRKEDILGVLSLIIYTLVLIPMIKYVFIVLRANDNGDGGTFALYSLICQHAKVRLIPNEQPEDSQLSNYNFELPSSQFKRAQKIKRVLESSKIIQVTLFLLAILGTSMVIGDGILTPCISVLSAVSGISSLGTETVMWISVGILIVLFLVQRFGTDKVGFSFAPIICLWFLFIGGIGLYDLFKYDIGVLRAFNPKYMIDYFMRNGKDGWISLGGIVLCITGTEAMFADLGHFNVRAIQISFSGIVLPSLLAAYSGQAAYLTKYPGDVADTFYKAIPGPLYWPTLVIAVAAAIIASQAMISGAFAIISQSQALGCFPRVQVVHTSAKYEGQVYIPEINYFLMIGCVIVTLSFKTTVKIGNAYGIAVVAVMLITTCLLTLVMLVIWKTSIWWIVLFIVVFFSIECIYLSSALFKFIQGGYLPLGLAAVLMIIMGIWHYVHRKRYLFELRNQVSSEYIRELAANPNMTRIPGLGLLYSELVQGIPPIFSHFIDNIPSVYSVIVLVSIKALPISKVALDERFLFRQVEPKDYRMYRSVVRYGYSDPIEDPKEFEHQLVENLKEFIRYEYLKRELGNADSTSDQENIQHSTVPVKEYGNARGSSVHFQEVLDQTNVPNPPLRISSASIQSFNGVKSAPNSNRNNSAQFQGGAEEELHFLQKATESGVVHLIGESEVVAKPNSSLLKKIVVNYLYGFLRRNSRQGEKTLAVPRTRLLRVGMTYEI